MLLSDGMGAVVPDSPNFFNRFLPPDDLRGRSVGFWDVSRPVLVGEQNTKAFRDQMFWDSIGRLTLERCLAFHGASAWVYACTRVRF